MIVRRCLPVLLGLSLAASACGDDPDPPPPAAAQAGKTAAPKKGKKKEEAEVPAELPPHAHVPIDFTDAARARDPFMSYASEFARDAKKRVKSQREVVLDQYGLDELKLAGLVTGMRPARAMLIDPTRTGHVVHEGQFVGRSEVVQGGTSGAEYEINWRVDRIRDTDIVLVREDPANPDVPTATRVIPLRPEDVLAAQQ
jgi:type IV pilus assembly protein PilP